jgi:acyl-CoA reductase-like NAD-dependent aldehyde dehydrogenase
LTQPPSSPPSAAPEALAALRAAELRDGAPDADRRRALLRALEAALLARAEEIVAALDADYAGRCAEETLLAEVMVPLAAARHARARLGRWMKPRRVAVPFHFQPARAALEPVPKGVIGIMAPWNYPVQLVLMPLIDAIAAGNRCAVKPSEATPRTAALLAGLLERALGADMVRTVQGGPEVAAAFAAQPWDHLVFTGGTAVGRRVAAAAAPNLVPVTLELGGKCPALVLPGADLAGAARAILAAKQFNAGQTCVAPDTVMLVGHSRAAFVAACQASGLGACETAVINARQQDRLAALAEGAELVPLVPGGLALAFAPPGHALHREEVFGPILPVLEQATLAEALAHLRGQEHPLAVYLFGASAAEEAAVAAGTKSGALVSGRALEYAGMAALPFGGIGASGMGRRNSEQGFLELSNLRARVRHGRFSLARLLDPPRSARTRALVRRILR